MGHLRLYRYAPAEERPFTERRDRRCRGKQGQFWPIDPGTEPC